MANVKFKIKGNKKLAGYDSELEIDVDDHYEAYSKPIPEPTPYQGGYITWFNAFGVKEKTSGKEAKVMYKVTLSALPPGKRLFAMYDGAPHEIPTDAAGSGKIKFSLAVGDPPLGSHP